MKFLSQRAEIGNILRPVPPEREEAAPGGKDLSRTEDGETQPLSGTLRRFVPQGKLLLKPDVGTLVTGSTAEAEVEFSGGKDNLELNRFPSRAVFDWSVTDEQGNEVDIGSWLEGRGARTWSFHPGKPGRYTVSVTVTSHHFKDGPFVPDPVTFLVTSEAEREQEVFELLLAGPGADQPFEKTPSGEIVVKPAARALTLEEELAKVDVWIGAVEGLRDKGEMPGAQAEAYLEVLNGRKAELEERRQLVSGGQPYLAHGTFLDATSSAYTPLAVVLYGRTERVGAAVRQSFTLVDLTIAPDNPPVYVGEAEVPVEGDETAALRAAEAAAIDALTGTWSSINDYPDGTGRLGVRLSDGSLYERSFDTRNLRKTVKRGAGYVALGAGVVALGAAAFTAGSTAPAGVVVLEVGAGLLATGATLADIGVRLEERIWTDTVRADREMLLDVLQVASTVGGLGGLAKVLRGSQTLSNGKLLVGLAGLDAAQAMVITDGVRKDILQIEGEYLARQDALAASGAAPEDVAALLRERDGKISRVLGAAAVTGGLMLVSLGMAVKDVTTAEPVPKQRQLEVDAGETAKPKRQRRRKKTETAAETEGTATPAPEGEAEPVKVTRKKKAAVLSYEPDPAAIKKQLEEAKMLRDRAATRYEEEKRLQRSLDQMRHLANQGGIPAIRKNPPADLEEYDLEYLLAKENLTLADVRKFIKDTEKQQLSYIGRRGDEIARLDLRIEVLEDPRNHRALLPCFAGETPVWTAAGPMRIDQIEVGDLVLSYDFDSGSVVEREVLQIFRNRTLHFFAISWGGDVSVEATGRHRFWIADRQEWVEARDLTPGMECQVLEGRTLTVSGNRRRDAPEEATFNLQVEGTHNYFVGPGALVHNDGPENLALGGKHLIYRGTNENFPGYVYIGQTQEGIDRQTQHRNEARDELDLIATQLQELEATPGGTRTERYQKLLERKEFYEFKKDMVLQVLVKGLDKPAADYLEQRNIELERKLAGNEDYVVNRREQIESPEHLDKVIARIKKNPRVKEAGYCPE